MTIRITFAPILVALATACSAVVDADRFDQALDFQAFITNTEGAADTPMLVTLVDEDSGEVQARALLEGVFPDVTGDGVPARIFSAIDPNVDYDVIVVADENGDGTFATNSEATWFQPEVVQGVASVRGGRDAIETVDPPQTPRGDFVFTLVDFDAAHRGQLFELAVFDYDTGLAVGSYFRRETADVTEYTIRIPNIIEDGHTYDVQFYADLDGTFTLSGGDHRWREEHTAEGGTVTASFTHAAPFDADLDAF